MKSYIAKLVRTVINIIRFCLALIHPLPLRNSHKLPFPTISAISLKLFSSTFSSILTSYRTTYIFSIELFSKLSTSFFFSLCKLLSRNSLSASVLSYLYSSVWAKRGITVNVLLVGEGAISTGSLAISISPEDLFGSDCF